MRRLAAAMAVMAAVALPAPAAAQALPDAAFCAQLRRIVAAADDDEPFRALEIARPAPPSLGFVHGCGRSGDARQYFWLCSQNLAPDWLSAERLEADTRRCLPDAEPLPARHHGERRFGLGGIEIRIHESGGPRAHVGRIVSYVVAAAPAR